MFKLVSDYKPSGNQPEVIEELVNGIKYWQNTFKHNKYKFVAFIHVKSCN